MVNSESLPVGAEGAFAPSPRRKFALSPSSPSRPIALHSSAPQAQTRHSSRVTRHRADRRFRPVAPSPRRPVAPSLFTPPRRRRKRVTCHVSRVTAPKALSPRRPVALHSSAPQAQTHHSSRVTRHCAEGAPPTLLIRPPYVAHTRAM